MQQRIFKDLVKRFRENPFLLIEENKIITIDELFVLMESHGKNRLIVCDAYVRDIELIAELREYGFDYVSERGVIKVIDHHAPLKEFEKNVSSTNLAIKYVSENGTVGNDTLVLINHADADAVMSAAIVTGVFVRVAKSGCPIRKDEIVGCLDIFGAAAIAADHTGEENGIADMMQAQKFERDIEASLENLERLLGGKPLEPRVQDLLDKRSSEREKAKEIVRAGGLKKHGRVTYVFLEKNIDLAFWPSLVPEAWVILTFAPSKRCGNRKVARTRVGMRGLGKIILNDLGIWGFDPEWGGRWNAGSNRRGFGTDLSLEEYAALLNEKVGAYLSRNE